MKQQSSQSVAVHLSPHSPPYKNIRRLSVVEMSQWRNRVCQIAETAEASNRGRDRSRAPTYAPARDSRPRRGRGSGAAAAAAAAAAMLSTSTGSTAGNCAPPLLLPRAGAAAGTSPPAEAPQSLGAASQRMRLGTNSSLYRSYRAGGGGGCHMSRGRCRCAAAVARLPSSSDSQPSPPKQLK